MAAVKIDPELLAYLTPAELAEIDAIIASDPCPWRPLEGTQRLAYESVADIIGYGGAAGGGKTDLACGKALTHHRKAMMLRRIGTELSGIIDRLEELIGSRNGFNEQSNIWRTVRFDGVPLQIELGAVPNPGDERKYQGRPHDLLASEKRIDLEFIRDLAEQGKLRPVIDRTYPLEQIAQAHRYVEQGHKRGNVVISLGR